jgi:hypothetical protein
MLAHYDEIGRLKSDLESSIRERYRALNYTNINSKHDIDLETDDTGTTIHRLPIVCAAFLKRVGEGAAI